MMNLVAFSYLILSFCLKIHITPPEFWWQNVKALTLLENVDVSKERKKVMKKLKT